MMLSIDELVLARAGEMADHDGTHVGVVQIMGATAQLQAELISRRDALLANLAAPAAAPAEVAETPAAPEEAKP